MAMNGKAYLLKFMIFTILSWTSQLVAGTLVGELDKTNGNTADRFVYTLTIEGDFKEEPQFPTVDGLSVYSGGREESTQIFNGRYSRTVRLRYVLSPQRPGSFQIPEISLKIDGKEERTLPLQFTVKEIDPTEQRKQPFYVERELSKESVYEGEVFSITDRIFIGDNIQGRPQVAPLELPSGFRVYSADQTKSYSKNIAGKSFQIIERKYFVVADSNGSYSVPPFVAEVSVPRQNNQRRTRNPFGLFGPSGVAKRLQSPSRPLAVLPLPSEGRSGNFSGLVGQFQLHVQVSPQKVQVGDNVTVTATVSGLGETTNMSDLDLVPDDAPKFKVYKDKPIDSDTLDYEKGILGQRDFKFAVIPNQKGSLNIGKISVNYFDPQLETYQTVNADLGSISVAAAPGQTNAAPPLSGMDNKAIKQTEVANLGSDILGLHSTERLITQDTIAGSLWPFLGLSGIGGLSLVFLSYFMSQRQQTQKDRMIRSAYRNAFKRFLVNKRKSDSSQLSSSELAKSLEANLKKYLKDKLMVNTESMTVRDIEKLLKDRRVDSDDIESFTQLLQDIDHIKYSPEPKAQLDTIGNRLESLLMKLEKQC